MGKYAVEVASFDDRVHNMALTGVGDVTGRIDLLPDLYSGTFAFNGGSLDTHGGRFVYQRQLPEGLTATVNYDFGGVLDLDKNNVGLAGVRSNIVEESRHALAVKLAGTMP